MKKYEIPELEVIRFDEIDVITASPSKVINELPEIDF